MVLKTTVIILTRNEEGNIKNIIKGVRPYADEIIVVDGHSKDKTREIAKKEGTNVILDEGTGKGAAERLAVRHAKHEIIVFIDADGSYDPKDIKRIVEPIKKREADLVIGSRMKGGSDELHSDLSQFLRLMGNVVLTLIINYRFNKKLTDCESGFRAIRRSVFLDIKTNENSFTIEQEVVIKCIKKGYKISEIASHEYSRKYGKSNLKLWKDGPKFLLSIIKNIF